MKSKKGKRKRQYKDAVNRRLWVNHQYMFVLGGPHPNKLERHSHYKLAEKLAYQDALAGNRQHEHRYSDIFYQHGYFITMQRYGQQAVKRAIEEYRQSNMPDDWYTRRYASPPRYFGG